MTRNQLLRYIFWEWVEPIGVALGIALLIMNYIMALYVIPTGSMQPTLRGKNDYFTGDKVLVNKFVYRMDSPERWDVFVFKYPNQVLTCDDCETDLDREIPLDANYDIPEDLRCPKCGSDDLEVIEKDYIKRCVGLPGDVLTIHDGNLLKQDPQKLWHFIDKTPLAQDALWIPIYRSSDNPEAFDRFLKWRSGGDKVTPQGLRLAKGVGHSAVWNLPAALHGNGDKGPRGGGHGEDRNAPPVGDIKIELQLVEAPTEGNLTLGLIWNGQALNGDVNFKDHTLTLTQKGQPLKQMGFAENCRSFSFARIDGQLELVAGDSLLRHEQLNLDPQKDTTVTISPQLIYRGSEMNIESLCFYRDIYYTSIYDDPRQSNPTVYEVPANSYFALGDNSYFSSDSRVWGYVPQKMLIGKALSVILPLGQIGLIH